MGLQLRRKLIGWGLGLCLVAAAFTGCGPADASGDDDTRPDAPVPPICETDLPASLNYSGREIRILTASPASVGTEVFAEELNSDIVNDTIFNRKCFVEDLLHVKLLRVGVPEGSSAADVIRKESASASGAFDLCAIAAQDMDLALEGTFLTLDAVPYLNDRNAAWWSEFSDAAALGYAAYFVTGDPATSVIGNLTACFYNKGLAENFSLPDLYAIVDGGQWTLDRMAEISNGVYIDVNGDDRSDEGDVFGLAFSMDHAEAFWCALDLPMIEKGTDGRYVCRTNWETFGNAYEKLFRYFGQRSAYPADGGEYLPYELMASDRTLFCFSTLSKCATVTLRNMSEDYGILPLPKADEKQARYQTTPGSSFTVFCVPSSAKNPGAVGAALEALGCYSREYVTDAYLEVTLKGKYANDPQTRRMVDTIIAGKETDAAFLYRRETGDLPALLPELLSERSPEYAAEAAVRADLVAEKLTELNEQLLPES